MLGLTGVGCPQGDPTAATWTLTTLFKKGGMTLRYLEGSQRLPSIYAIHPAVL